MEIIFTDRFLSRIESFSDFIAINNIGAALKWVEGIFDHCEQLRLHPYSGRIVPEFGRPEIRELIHGSYRLVYEVKVNQIDVLTIWHSSQIPPDKP